MRLKEFSTVILAAGKGTRMKSPLPKVLHPVAGTPILKKVIEAVRGAGASDVRVVVGYSEALVRKVAEPLGANCFVQGQQNGTADAVRSAQVESLNGDVMILNGDHPLLLPEDVKEILQEFRESSAALAVVSVELKNPGSFGRIIRHQGQLRAIVEVTEASRDTLKIGEVNTGIYVVKSEVLQTYLPRIQNHNAKKEFYLTDLIQLAHEGGEKMIAIRARKRVGFGVNCQSELAQATRILFARKRRQLMDDGVILIDPDTTYVEDEVQVGHGSVLYPGVYLRGRTRLGSFCVVEPGCYIAHSHLEDSVQVKASTYMESVIVRSQAILGPFARLRPETEIGPEAHIGNFVELKKTKFGARSKAGHLTYLGDAEIGEDVNIGCGTITCNYAVDRKKYKTRIGHGVFVGSDTQFVAPISIGEGAIIGSGSTITKDVPARALAVARGKQVNVENYADRIQAGRNGVKNASDVPAAE